MKAVLKLTTILLLAQACIASTGITHPNIVYLWSQYCQHLGQMTLLVHLDTDPSAAAESLESVCGDSLTHFSCQIPWLSNTLLVSAF